jgi:hypothetical protein
VLGTVCWQQLMSGAGHLRALQFMCAVPCWSLNCMQSYACHAVALLWVTTLPETLVMLLAEQCWL